MSDYVHIPVVKIKHATEKAFLIVVEDDDETELWVPVSQVSMADQYDVGDENITMSISRWFVNQPGNEVLKEFDEES